MCAVFLLFAKVLRTFMGYQLFLGYKKKLQKEIKILAGFIGFISSDKSPKERASLRS